MIPIVSWLYYRGKSRCCGEALSYQYPIVEALIGLLFLWWASVGYLTFALVSAPLFSLQPIFWLVSGVLIMTLGLADWYYGVVLVPVVYAGIAWTLLYRFVLWYFGAYQIADWGAAIALAGLAYGFFWLMWRITRGRGMGEGDMYVAFYLALLLGWPRGLVMLFLSFVLGASVGIALMILGVRKRSDSLPFVPFMAVASGIALYFGEEIIRFLG